MSADMIDSSKTARFSAGDCFCVEVDHHRYLGFPGEALVGVFVGVGAFGLLGVLLEFADYRRG